MPRVPCYGDQWNILPPHSASVDELRACALYEYARECEDFVDLVDQHRLAPDDTKHSEHLGFFGFTHFDFLQAVSPALASLVRAMGDKASLAKPWSKLPAGIRTKIVAACSASVRLATPDELEGSYCWQFCGEMPAMDTMFHIGPECDDAAGDDPRRLLCLVLDTRATATQIKADIGRLFDKSIAPLLRGKRGRGASGKEPLWAALRSLAVMRLLSTRGLAVAQTVAQAAGCRDLLPEKEKDSTRYQRIDHARRTFRTLFPGLFIHEAFQSPPQMLSDAAYSSHGSRGRGRKRRR